MTLNELWVQIPKQYRDYPIHVNTNYDTGGLLVIDSWFLWTDPDNNDINVIVLRTRNE